MSISDRLKELNDEISKKYEDLLDFYGDNSTCAVMNLEYYEKLLVEARELFKDGNETTQEEKNVWFDKVKDIEKK